MGKICWQHVTLGSLVFLEISVHTKLLINSCAEGNEGVGEGRMRSFGRSIFSSLFALTELQNHRMLTPATTQKSSRLFFSIGNE